MSRVDRALEVLDAGLQSSTPEHDDVWMAPPGRCTRCRNRNTADPERALCDLCRAYLLGDSDLDPTRPPEDVIGEFARRLADAFMEAFGPLIAAFDGLGRNAARLRVVLVAGRSRKAWRRAIKAAALVEHHERRAVRAEVRLAAAQARPWKLDHARLSKARRRR